MQIFNFSKGYTLSKSIESNYMTNNPNRRCPNIDLARKKLLYNPSINVHEGVERFLKFLSFGDKF